MIISPAMYLQVQKGLLVVEVVHTRYITLMDASLRRYSGNIQLGDKLWADPKYTEKFRHPNYTGEARGSPGKSWRMTLGQADVSCALFSLQLGSSRPRIKCIWKADCRGLFTLCFLNHAYT